MTQPLIPQSSQATPNQRFAVTLAGTTYRMKLRWCDPAACWILDIADQNGNPLLQGIPLITGADLLEQYAYVGIPGGLMVQSDQDANAVPTLDNLGTLGHLYFLTAAVAP